MKDKIDVSITSTDLDGPALWRGTAVVTSVITTTVVTSTILPGSGLIDGNDRPSSVPPIVSPHLLAGGYGASEPMSESQLDQFQVKRNMIFICS